MEKKPFTARSIAFAVLFVLLAGWSLVRPGPSTGPNVPVWKIHGETMGTTFTVKVVDPPEPNYKSNLEKLIRRELVEINQQMSTYIPDSNISRINKAGANVATEIPAELMEVLLLSQEISGQTNGAFDITVAPLVNAYGFGPGEKIEDETELAALKELVNYRTLEFDLNTSSVKKPKKEIELTLSAVAKGYGVDQIAKLLEKQGISNYMVEIGGEIRTGGYRREAQRWRIGIERPTSSADEGQVVQTIVGLSNYAMATSGDYRNYYEENGKRVSHTLDPRTGKPIEHRLASVTVLHDSAALADAYATALNVMGPDQAFDWANKNGLAIYLLVRSEDGGFVELSTSAFHSFVVSKPKIEKKL